MQFYATMIEKRVEYGWGGFESSKDLLTIEYSEVNLPFRDALQTVGLFE